MSVLSERSNVVDVSGIPSIASANTIAPTRNVMVVTGNTTIKTITPPDPYFVGPLWLYNVDSSVGSWDTTGNIALAGTMTRYKMFAFFYNRATSKWYPSAAS